MKGIKRSITHWTAGTGRASALDKKHYHRITEFDGTIVEGNEAIEDNIVASDGDYAAHTLNLNTGSAGFAMAGMHGAQPEPFDPGAYPLREEQFEAHCQMLARFHHEYGLLPITRENCLTHAEVEPTLGVKQRGKWDITRLPFKPELRGAIPVGDYMRDRVRSYLGVLPPVPETNRPILRVGDRGAFVLDLQDLLIRKRFFTGKRDGIFGPRTKAALRAFQDHAGIASDGICGPQTWKMLMAADVDPAPTRDVSEDDLRKSGSRTIKEADSGEMLSKALGAGAGGLATLEVVMDGVDKLAAAAEPLQAAQEVLVDNWIILLVIALAAAGYFALPRVMERIRLARTEDAVTGGNLKR